MEIIALLKKPFLAVYLYFIYNYRRWLSIILYGLCENHRKNNALLKSYKDKYKGRRCFVVCNGPSLQVADLELLQERNEITFSCNAISKIFSQTNWRPTFYTMLDDRGQLKHFDWMNDVPCDCHFYSKEAYLLTKNLPHKKVWLNKKGDKDLLYNPKFSKDCDKIIYTIGTVTFAMLELASYMGFADIYIIGCDHQFAVERTKEGRVIINTNVHTHFKGAEKTIIPSQITKWSGNGKWEMDIAYKCAREASDSNEEFTIYNATRGGQLETFERVDFNTLFSIEH